MSDPSTPWGGDTDTPTAEVDPVRPGGVPVVGNQSGPGGVQGTMPGRLRHRLPELAVRVLATGALAAFVATYVALEVDLLRRHFPGIDPVKYWGPQVRQITLPGLAATLVCAALAFVVHRFWRRSSPRD